MAFTRLFFATDVHGSEKAYLKFLNAPKFYKAHHLILGGDITGKAVIPIIKTQNGYEATFRGIKRQLKDDAQREQLEKQILDSGSYPYHTDPNEMAVLQNDERRVDAIFRKLMLERLDRWIQLASERLKDSGVSMYVTGGNDDIAEINPVIEKSNFVVDPEDKVVVVAGNYEMASLGMSNPTPWQTPRECSEEELWQKIERMTSQVTNMKSCIFNFHVPPVDTMISECQKLDENFKPVYVGSDPVIISGGSVSVRKAIEQYQPMLGLHGHIHESRGEIKIGRTTCINPGSEYGEGILRGAIVNLDGDSVKSHQLTAG